MASPLMVGAVALAKKEVLVKEIQAGREDAALMFCVRSELGGHPGQRDEPAAYEHPRPRLCRPRRF